MGTGHPLTLRTPLIVLALADLALLGKHLWPWKSVLNLPGNGATGIDPAVMLLAYCAIIFWLGGSRVPILQSLQSAGTLLGVVSGLILVAQVVLRTRAGDEPSLHARHLRVGLLIAAAVVCGIAGWRGSRIIGNVGGGVLSGIWSAMVGCLMACSAVVAEMYLAAPTPPSPDPWKQYESLAIDPVAHALIRSLNAATGFLAVGPLAGGAIGLIFGFFAPPQKS